MAFQNVLDADAKAHYRCHVALAVETTNPARSPGTLGEALVLLAAEREYAATLAADNARLRDAYQRLQLDLLLLRRRLFVAKA